MDTIRESVLKVDSGTLWEKIPMLHWDSKPTSVVCFGFSVRCFTELFPPSAVWCSTV